MIAAVLESIDHMFGPEGELGKPLEGVARPAIDAVYTYHQENYSETCSESDRRRLSASYMLGSRKLALCPPDALALSTAAIFTAPSLACIHSGRALRHSFCHNGGVAGA